MDDEVRVATATTDSTEAHCDVLQYCVYQPGSFSTEELQILLPSLQQLYDYAVEVGLISEGDQCAIPHIGKNPKAFVYSCTSLYLIKQDMVWRQITWAISRMEL